MFDLLLNLVGPPALLVLGVYGLHELLVRVPGWLGRLSRPAEGGAGTGLIAVRDASPLCTCPFGGCHDGLFVANPSCPAHGRRA